MSVRDASSHAWLSPTELRAWASRSLACYALAITQKFELPPHVKIIIEQLEMMERGELTRLIVCLPPRHGKSFLATVLFVAWYLGRHPDHRIIVACYGQELADDFGRQVRNLIIDPRHQAIFPRCRMSEDSTAANRFSTTSGGSYVAVGAGGPITGRGADLFLIDDPIKGPEEAKSPTSRHGMQEWFAQVARTRLMPGGKIMLIQNRWHEDDLVGWLRREHSQEGWNLISFPAIAEHDEAFRKEGEALWPERLPLKELEGLRRLLGTAPFSALYQQRPLAAEGLVFHRAWFPDYQECPRPKRVVQSWDPAFKKGSENSYSVCTTWGEGEDGYFLLHLYRDRIEFPELKRVARSLATQFKPEAILIEDKASGQSLLQELQHDSFLPIVPIKVDADKVARAQSVTPLVEAGRVRIPATAPWRGEFLDEVAAFPYGAHDDIVDSMVQALRYLRDHSQRWSNYEILMAAFGGLGLRDRHRDPYLEAGMVELPPGYDPRRGR